MIKRFLCILFTVVCLSSSLSPSLLVYAADDVVTQYDTFRQLFDEEGQIHIDDFVYFISKGDNDALNGAIYALTKIGFAIPNLTVNASLKLVDIFSFGYSSNFIALSRVNGLIKYSEDFINYLVDASNNYVVVNGGFFIIPQLAGFPDDLDEAVSILLKYCSDPFNQTLHFNSSDYQDFSKFVETKNSDLFVQFKGNQIDFIRSSYLPRYYFLNDAKLFCTNTFTAGSSYSYQYSSHSVGISNNSLNHNTSGYFYWDNPFSNGYPVYSRNRTVRVFTSRSNLMRYYDADVDKELYCSSDYYNHLAVSDYSGFSGIPENNIFDYDWKNINSSVYDAVKDSDNGITEDELQTIIDGYFDEITDALGDVNEGIVDNGEKLDDLILQISKSGERQSSWLAKIFDYLCEILPVIDGHIVEAGSGSSGSGASDQAVTDRLDSIISLLEDNLDILEDIEGNTADIRTLLALDDAENSFFDLMAYKLQTSESVMKERFPTSIPWDVMLVVSAFAEEP